MAPAESTSIAPSPKTSLRQRLFSTGSRKAAAKQVQGKDATRPDHLTVPAANLPIENSPSTSSTLTPSKLEGLAPTSQLHASRPAQLLSVAAAPVLDAGLRPQQDDSDKEQGSVNATLIAKDRRLPFYRRKDGNTSYTSDAALSSTSDPSLIKNGQGRTAPGTSLPRPRPSFFSRVLHTFVPCVGSDPRIVISQEDDAVFESQPIPSKDNTNHVEMQNIQPESLVVPPLKTEQPSIDLESLPLAITSTGVPQPPSPTDSEVIVPPPASTHLLPEDETDGVTSGAVQPPGSTGSSGEIVRAHTHDTISTGDESDGTSYTDDEGEDRHIMMDQDEEDLLIKNGGSGIPVGPDGQPKPLLPPISPQHVGRKCLVLDLDETLVHSSFKAVQQADFIVPVEIEYHWHHFHVLKRPGVDNFLKQMGEIYEVVVFTASLSKYADPVLDKLDIHKVVAHRLFRESCFSHKGNYVKDLSQLGRPIADTIILDNSPASYIFHPNNAVPVSSWFNDPHDAELTDLIPFLADLTFVPDVRGILDGAR